MGLGGAAQRLREPGSAHRTFYTFIETVEWYGFSASSSFSLPLAHMIVHPVGGRVYPNDGYAVDDQMAEKSQPLDRADDSLVAEEKYSNKLGRQFCSRESGSGSV